VGFNVFADGSVGEVEGNLRDPAYDAGVGEGDDEEEDGGLHDLD